MALAFMFLGLQLQLAHSSPITNQSEVDQNQILCEELAMLNEMLPPDTEVLPETVILDFSSLDQRYGDAQTRIEQLEEINKLLRQRDKMKDDAIGQLSDQLMEPVFDSVTICPKPDDYYCRT
jgi:hypothetical protein